MNKFMYRTSRCQPISIEKLKVVKVTEKTITYKGEWWGKEIELKELKETTTVKWHDTWKEARDFLLKRAEDKIDAAKREIERQRKIIGIICEMKEDE